MNLPEYQSLDASLPLPEEVGVLADFFQTAGKSLFVVGGAVRDYLYNKIHLPNADFKPKDIDLCTEASPEEVITILSSREAKEAGVTVFPKGISFGVVSALIGGIEFEIATFREDWYDPESGDGRRPDKVKYSTPKNDAARRDLTINSLFYDINAQEIRDYNLDPEGRGMGIQDIENKVVRAVGNARDRFREDRLRIIRLVRFFCRLNDGNIFLDTNTLEAIKEFRDLPGVSAERIAMEFMSGIKQSLNPTMFLRNYESLGLFSATFPGMKVEIQDVKDVRNPAAIIAWILKSNGGSSKVKTALIKQKYSGSVFDVVEFLLQLYEFEPEKIVNLLRRRDKYKQEIDPLVSEAKNYEIRKNVMDFAKIAGLEDQMNKFLNYESQIKSEDYMHLEPSKRGKAIAADERKAYFKI